MSVPVDRFARPLRSLRLSVTDRCNLRCTYCMPEQQYVWLPKTDILSFSEIRRLVERFAALGVDRLRMSGGEPLVRADLPVLVRMLAGVPGIEDLALTTNALRLPGLGAELRDAGMQRLTVSLDTLRRERFVKLAGRDRFDDAIAGIESAAQLGFRKVKLNMVVLRGANDDELADMLEFGRGLGIEVRFIEYMDVGGATGWRSELVVSRREILDRVRRRFGPIAEIARTCSAPADRFVLPDGTEFGVISSTTAPFCASCDRSRITADGMWFTCLYARAGVDLRGALRSGASEAELDALIARTWSGRADRGAEERLALDRRSPLADQRELRAHPHLEMHTRGG